MIPKPNISKTLLTSICCAAFQLLWAQNSELINFCGWRPAVISQDLPVDLTSSRCAVIISMDPDSDDSQRRPDWGKFAFQIHSELRKMYIDPICYAYEQDLNAGPEVRKAFISAFKERGVKNLIFFDQSYAGLDEVYGIKIAQFNEQKDLIANRESVWIQDDAPFNLIILRLGRQIIRQDLERTNFLIPEKPNLINDLPLFAGMQLSSYPGLIRRSKLAVIIPDKYEIFQGLSPSETEILTSENLRIEREIQEIESIMSMYPYPYELVPYDTDEALSRKGFQYALMSFHSTGTIIKKMLNYKVSGAETDFISVIPKDSIGVTLKTIPVDRPVYKYYIKQTLAHDAYVGKEWDSDFAWESAMRNFLINLTRALR